MNAPDTSPVTPGSSASAPAPAGAQPSLAVSISGWLLAAALVECVAETVWVGSPIRWWALGVLLAWAVVTAAGWRALTAGCRLVINALFLVGLVAFATWRLGAAANPGLHLFTLTLPRIAVALVLLAVAVASFLLARVPVLRRAEYPVGVIVALGVYALAPLGVALYRGIPIAGSLRGDAYWPDLPFWLQGGFIGTQVLLPIGLVVAAVALVRSLFARERRPAAWLPGLAWVIGASALFVASVEMTRGGTPNLAGPVLSRVLPARGQASASGEAPGSAGVAGSAGRDTTTAARGTGAQGSTVPSVGTMFEKLPGALPPPSGRTATTRAVELTVDGVETIPSLGGRSAGADRTFVVVSTSWKNVIPLTLVEHKKPDRTQGAGGLGFGAGQQAAPSEPATMEPTPYVVPGFPKHLWLVVNDRFSEPIDVRATSALEGALPTDRFRVEKLGDVLRGRVAFEVPASTAHLALLFLDSNFGNALVSVKGQPSDAPAVRALGPLRQNEVVALSITEASWPNSGPAPPAGMRRLVLGLRGTSVSAGNLAEIRFAEFGHVLTDKGYVSWPERDASWLPRPFPDPAVFVPGAPNEGQLSFLVPDDTRQTMFLLRARGAGPVDLPAPDEVKPSWPQPVRTIADGTTLRVLVLPAVDAPASVPARPSGRRNLVLDLVVENLKPSQGIEFQAEQQLRIVDSSGARIPPSADSERLPYHLAGNGVIPAGGLRRFQLLYVVPSGPPLRLEYRGFEKSETAELPRQ